MGVIDPFEPCHVVVDGVRCEMLVVGPGRLFCAVHDKQARYNARSIERRQQRKPRVLRRGVR